MEGSRAIQWATAAAVSVALLLPGVAHADPAGLVASYNFDEATGMSAVDASGNGNTGTLAGATHAAAGRNGGALSFDGVDDLVTVADSASLDLTTGLTLEAWVNPSGSGNWRSILMKERPGYFSYALYTSDTNRPTANVFTSFETYTTSLAQAPTNAWTHLASTYDGTTLRLYVNGAQVSTRSVSGSIITSSGALRIGGNALWDEFFAGRIDDVRVYNRALTAAEVLADRNTPVTSFDTQAPSAPGDFTATISNVKQVDLSWTAASDDRGVTGYRVYRSTTAGFTPSATTLRTTVATPAWSETLTAPGLYYYKVIAVDAAGNAGPASAEATADASDTTPPTAVLGWPNDGQGVARNVYVSVGGSDDWGIVSKQLQVDGGTPFDYLYGPWSTYQLENGPHTLVALVKDAAGNVDTSEPITVHVLNGARPVSVTAPTAGSTVSGTVTLKADAESPFGVDRVFWTIGSGTSWGSRVASDSEPPYEVELDSSLWAGVGEHWVMASYYDESSEYPWDSPKVNVTFDNTVGAPGGLTAAVDGDDVHLTWSAPTGGTLPAAYYTIHRGTTPNFGLSSLNQIARVTELSFDDLDRPNGTYYYTVLARAASGFSDGRATVAAVVDPPDTVAPTVTVGGACNSANVSGTVELTATASDNVGVASVQFKVGGADLGSALTSAPYSRNWDTKAFPDGAHVITAVARDAAGNTTTSAECPFTVSNPVAPPSLLAAYGFEETSGPAVTDGSGRGHTGTISGAVRTAAGKFGRALTYDGVDDLVEVAHTSALNVSSAVTVEAWVRPTANGGWRTAVMKQRGDDTLYTLYATTGFGNRASWNVVRGDEAWTLSPNALPLNSWTHLASTYDGSALRVYINGALVSSQSASGTMPSSSGPLTIGGNRVWSEWFKGEIDEVRVYSRALSAAEIVADRDTAIG